MVLNALLFTKICGIDIIKMPNNIKPNLSRGLNMDLTNVCFSVSRNKKTMTGSNEIRNIGLMFIAIPNKIPEKNNTISFLENKKNTPHINKIIAGKSERG